MRDFEQTTSPTRIMSKNLWANKDSSEVERPNSSENFEQKPISNPRPETLNLDETDSLRRPRPYTLVLKQSSVPEQTRNRDWKEPEQTNTRSRNRNRKASDQSVSDQDTFPDEFPIRSTQADRDDSRPSSVLKVRFIQIIISLKFSGFQPGCPEQALGV